MTVPPDWDRFRDADADGAWWPWPDKALTYRHLGALWRYVVEQTEATTRTIDQLRRRIMATADDLAARIDAATSEVAEDVQAVKDELARVLSGLDAEKQTAVDEALAKLEAPIARLEALGADPDDPDPEAPSGGGDAGGGEVITNPTEGSEDPNNPQF